MKQLTIVLGTKNRHKIREMMAIYRRFNNPKLKIRFIPLYRFPNAPSVPETGQTYLANASKKALAWARYTGLPTLAEDSGIEVKALNWQPGIYSARYASVGNRKNAPHKDNNQKLLAKLKGLPISRRIARYRCSAVIASPNGKIIARAQGACWGRIAFKPAGQNGFGYDPIFIPKLLTSNFKHPRQRRVCLRHRGTRVPITSFTFGQFPAWLKHQISHRGIALRKIFLKLPKIIDIS